MDIDWKKILGGIAPLLVPALGVPATAAGVIVGLSNALFGRDDASEQDIATAIAGGHLTPEQTAAIVKLNNDFRVQMAQINADTEKAYLSDVQDARRRQIETKDYTPQAILAALFLLWAACFGLFYLVPMPTDEFLRALITRSYATIENALPGAIAYFVGSSRGSKQSGDAVRRIAEQK